MRMIPLTRRIAGHLNRPRPATALPGLALGLLVLAGCGSSMAQPGATTPAPAMSAQPPSPDPRVGLRAGMYDAGEAFWNMRLVSTSPSRAPFSETMNSDLAFTGPYVIQGNFNGYQVWDMSDPARPVRTREYYCPASQSDVSVYRHLLFVSGEDLAARIDCGAQGVREAVSKDRLRGLRIFDISDIRNPRNVGNVQTCRGAHTHTVVEDPKDPAHVYIYISGSSSVRPAEELPGCVNAFPEDDPNTALFRIEVIRVPVANPERAAIVSSPRIFEDLEAPPRHAATAADRAAAERALAEARAAGAFVVTIGGTDRVLPSSMVDQMLGNIVRSRGGSGAPTAADSASLRAMLPQVSAQKGGGGGPPRRPRDRGPTQCHDITVYPALGLAGGACEGYGLLLDISDPVNPVRIDAVADSNFAYWHSATFNNDGSKVLFTDEWGGGTQPKCRASDRPEWGANAVFTVKDRKMAFGSYFKIPAAQTEQENCVAHNGSLIPIPGRDVMVQGWYQGGVSVFDFTDAANPVEIAYFDRGPVDSLRMVPAGSWSAYWYNGYIVSSEIARGLDILELTPSAHLSRHELAAAKSVRFDYLNAQGQPRLVWPPSFALARAYVDQLERSGGLLPGVVASTRNSLDAAERTFMGGREHALLQLAQALALEAGRSRDAAKVRTLVVALQDLAAEAVK